MIKKGLRLMSKEQTNITKMCDELTRYKEDVESKLNSLEWRIVERGYLTEKEKEQYKKFKYVMYKTEAVISDLNSANCMINRFYEVVKG